MSGLVSAMSGALLGLSLLLLQLPLLWLKHRLETNEKNTLLLCLAQASKTFLLLVGTVSVTTSFRGVWYLWDVLFLPNTPVASFVLGGVLGGAGLMVLGSSASLNAGIFRDGVRDNPATVKYYFATFYYIKQQKKSQAPS